MRDLARERDALAEAAARRVLAALPPGPVTARLRLLTTAELLCPAPPPRRPAGLCDELRALEQAAQAAVRRRPGWLTVECGKDPLTVSAPPRLVQAAVLSVWRCALLEGTNTGACCRRAGSAAVVQLWGASARLLARSDAAALLSCLARRTGGTLLLTACGPGTAVLRLPLCGGTVAPAPEPEQLLTDRYSLPHLYLAGFCAGEEP